MSSELRRAGPARVSSSPSPHVCDVDKRNPAARYSAWDSDSAKKKGLVREAITNQKQITLATDGSGCEIVRDAVSAGVSKNCKMQ
jgi:hypothetical protein